MTKCPSQSNEETYCKIIQNNPKILFIIKPLLKHYGCLSGFDLPAKAHRIPTNFMDELVEEMPDMASLTVSSSRSWNIKVVKGKDGITLEDGWEKFRDDNNLSRGEVLLFRYSGNWKFEVEIFSPNGCSRKLEDTEEEGKQILVFSQDSGGKDGTAAADANDDSSSSSSTKNRPSQKGSRKNVAITGPSRRDDGNTEFAPGKMRQAFPASGNRSATFR
ncbi:hypothetical protein M9H77_28412 [Catharanthus roseus]|uniref:Uncharacterized protein n=1 Tax=Catharanthus roseus TaxID=4058 RepID=A0ACC0AFN8_CATRO|nr:hypothetical protein M9H77_28412 [Catharanthus roseus]